MKKIPTLFARNYDTDELVRDELTPGCEWVLRGEGVATRKIDGTCAMVREGKLYKRYDARNKRVPPEGFEPTEEAPDPHTGHWPGWLPIGENPEDKFFREAWENAGSSMPEGTYELLGPKIQNNLEGLDRHELWPHGTVMENVPRTYEELKEYLKDKDIEGIVFYGPDGERAKIKLKDFGYKRPRQMGLKEGKRSNKGKRRWQK